MMTNRAFERATEDHCRRAARTARGRAAGIGRSPWRDFCRSGVLVIAPRPLT